MTKRRRRITRSAILFSAGLAGVALETLYSLRYHESPDSTLILLFSAMMGLPVYLYRDNEEHKDSDDPGAPKHRSNKDEDRAE